MRDSLQSRTSSEWAQLVGQQHHVTWTGAGLFNRTGSEEQPSRTVITPSGSLIRAEPSILTDAMEIVTNNWEPLPILTPFHSQAAIDRFHWKGWAVENTLGSSVPWVVTASVLYLVSHRALLKLPSTILSLSLIHGSHGQGEPLLPNVMGRFN